MYSLSRYILRPNQPIIMKSKKPKVVEWHRNFLSLLCIAHDTQNSSMGSLYDEAIIWNQSKRTQMPQ